MIPVPGIDDVRIYWLKVRHRGVILHGYLLYTHSDHLFPEYMSNEGMGDLDIWTGSECNVFVFQRPPEGWAQYAIRTNHIWSELVGQVSGRESATKIAAAGQDVTVSIDGQEVTLKELFAGCSNYYIQRDLIADVLAHFDLPRTTSPCLILFTDLYGKQFWVARLDDLLNRPEGELRKALKKWFEGPDFARALDEARRANRKAA